MIIAMSIGNTNFVLGTRENNLVNVIRYPVEHITSSEDFVKIITDNIDIKKADGIIISSVNPKLNPCLEEAVKIIFSLTPVIVNSHINMKLNLDLYDTKLLGNDRIAVCEAAIAGHEVPAVIFDFGTATTINVVDSKNRFIGGTIMPGINMGLKALFNNTAQLPDIELSPESPLLGLNTKECIISGALFGNAAMLDGMVQRIQASLPKKAAVIITGGNAANILPLCETKLTYKPELLISGLFELFDKNNPQIKG
jgi:type III pantothenate kinase